MENNTVIEWKYCIVGNIKEKHEYGEDKEICIGTKQFSPGTKVYKPVILKKMNESIYVWWDDTEKSKNEMEWIINTFNGDIEN